MRSSIVKYRQGTVEIAEFRRTPKTQRDTFKHFVVKSSYPRAANLHNTNFLNGSLAKLIVGHPYPRWSCRRVPTRFPIGSNRGHAMPERNYRCGWQLALERCRSQARNARNKEMAARNDEISRIEGGEGDGKKERERERERSCKQRGQVTSQLLVLPTSSVVVPKVLRGAKRKKKKRKNDGRRRKKNIQEVSTRSAPRFEACVLVKEKEKITSYEPLLQPFLYLSSPARAFLSLSLSLFSFSFLFSIHDPRSTIPSWPRFSSFLITVCWQLLPRFRFYSICC